MCHATRFLVFQKLLLANHSCEYYIHGITEVIARSRLPTILIYIIDIKWILDLNSHVTCNHAIHKKCVILFEKSSSYREKNQTSFFFPPKNCSFTLCRSSLISTVKSQKEKKSSFSTSKSVDHWPLFVSRRFSEF